jgi:hypothetical protein
MSAKRKRALKRSSSGKPNRRRTRSSVQPAKPGGEPPDKTNARRRELRADTHAELDSEERIALDDFLMLLDHALKLRSVCIDPKLGFGGECLTDWEIGQQQQQYAPRLVELNRALLTLAERAGTLRRLMRVDPDPHGPLPPGVYGRLLSERGPIRGADELWQTAVAWTVRALKGTHDAARSRMVASLEGLVDRRLVTAAELQRARTESRLRPYVDERFDHATRKRAPRGTKFAVAWLAGLTGVSGKTIRAAAKRAEEPRPLLPRGTTLEQREDIKADMARARAVVVDGLRTGEITLPQPITRLR